MTTPGGFSGFSPSMVAELERLIAKLAHKETSFTPREHQLMELIKQNREVILPQLEAARRLYKGTNTAGKEKLDNLIKAIERICMEN